MATLSSERVPVPRQSQPFGDLPSLLVDGQPARTERVGREHENTDPLASRLPLLRHAGKIDVTALGGDDRPTERHVVLAPAGVGGFFAMRNAVITQSLAT